jgi:transposase-like protein
MGRKLNKNIDKGAIISEYLAGGITYRELSQKHGVSFKGIQRWVTKYTGAHPVYVNNAIKAKTQQMENIPDEVRQLQNELRKAKLQNEMLNAMIYIAEEQMNIKIRKKSGTRQP